MPSSPGGSRLIERIAPVRRIAVLKASRIGDFMCATPAFRALRAAFSDASITLITLPMLSELAARLPYFDRIALFPGYPGIAEQLFDARRALEFFRGMHALEFDLALQLQGSGVYSNPFLLMLGATASAGFVRPGDGAGRLDAALAFPDTVHEVERQLSLLRFLGIGTRGSETEFPLQRQDLEEAARLLAPLNGRLIGLHPAARQTERRWPLERFVAAAGELSARYDDVQFVVIGDGDERETGEVLRAALGHRCLNLAGETSLTGLAGVIARLSLLITSDSGPAHIAYPLRTPTVTIFRSGGRLRYGPPAGSQFVGLEPQSGQGRVSVVQVVRAAERLLQPARPKQCVEGELQWI